MHWLEPFVYKLPRSVVRIFRGRNLAWIIAACGFTYIIAMSGFDWAYFEATRSSTLFAVLFPAAIIGFFVPIFLPFVLFTRAWHKKNQTLKNTAYAVTQAAALGWTLSSLFKAFTGRAHPYVFTKGPFIDVTREFHFGFMQGGIFWGWPSSHTTVACAIAFAIVKLYPKHKKLITFVLLYTAYIAIGVSATVHWFSDVVAGAIMGTIVGLTVGGAFRERLRHLRRS